MPQHQLGVTFTAISCRARHILWKKQLHCEHCSVACVTPQQYQHIWLRLLCLMREKWMKFGKWILTKTMELWFSHSFEVMNYGCLLAMIQIIWLVLPVRCPLFTSLLHSNDAIILLLCSNGVNLSIRFKQNVFIDAQLMCEHANSTELNGVVCFSWRGVNAKWTKWHKHAHAYIDRPALSIQHFGTVCVRVFYLNNTPKLYSV